MPKKFSIDKLNSSQLVDMKGLKNSLSQSYKDYNGSISLASFINATKSANNRVVEVQNSLISHGKITGSDLDEEDIDAINKAQIQTFTSQVALLKTAKEEYGKRTFWDKFFHPFRTYSENKAIGNLENEIRDKYDVGDNILSFCNNILEDTYDDILYDKTITNEYGLIKNSALEKMPQSDKMGKEKDNKKEEELSDDDWELMNNPMYFFDSLSDKEYKQRETEYQQKKAERQAMSKQNELPNPLANLGKDTEIMGESNEKSKAINDTQIKAPSIDFQKK